MFYSETITYFTDLCVTVGRPPEILEPLLDMEIIAPEEAHLECDIDIGDPPARLVWYKDNKELRPGGKHEMEYGEEIATLVIRDTTTADAGTYRCEAANKLGRVETECTMVVQSKPLSLHIIIYLAKTE